MDLPRSGSFTPTLVEDGRVVVLDLHPGRVNEVGTAALRDLEALLGALEAHPAVGLVSRSGRVTPSGAPVFLAGADVEERVGWGDPQVLAHVRWQRSLFERLRQLPQYHLCVVDGLALGGGVEWVLAADGCVAGPRAVFGLPETGLGIVPGAGGTARLALRVGHAQALRLALTGQRVDASEALRIGLAQATAPSAADAETLALVLLRDAAHRSPTALAAYKRALLRIADGADPAAAEDAAYAACVASGDARTGRERFREVRAGIRIPWAPRHGVSEGS